MRPVRTTARALLSGIFIVSGARAVASPAQYADRAKTVTDRVAPMIERAAPRLPTDTESLVRLHGATQLTGGLLLATGRLTRPAAAVLAASLVPTTVAGHPFWSATEPTERQLHQVHFLKNLGLLGGLLLAAADTEGRPGLRWRTSRAIRQSRRSVRRSRRSVRRAVHSARRDARIAVRSAATARRLPG
ncbi:DoxX family membrane protein [Solwaraspora sp. WMMD937]|uniref:DoxX family membrane protein n=1 Tax=Solwaraspora sp. WMMD937 TaxID=3016090 RepID=UPI00249B8B78|nr:DoxX family membrane protein [Solwaraspora sp. WMMD937]WFE22864.1 DoxX family membrane protein [Solwaraspora sp. WMMD937]